MCFPLNKSHTVNKTFTKKKTLQLTLKFRRENWVPVQIQLEVVGLGAVRAVTKKAVHTAKRNGGLA